MLDGNPCPQDDLGTKDLSSRELKNRKVSAGALLEMSSSSGGKICLPEPGVAYMD